MTSRQAVFKRFLWAGWLAVICLSPARPAVSQQFATVNSSQFPVLYLPSTRYVYYHANLIDAQSRWMAANGYQQIALAKARQMHATAASMEMDNAIKWVHTYFTRKKLNRQYRRELYPGYRERVEKADRLKHHMLENQPEFFFKGQVADEMNWMLDRLATEALTHSLFFGPEAVDDEMGLNKTLDRHTIEHLIVSPGERVEGHQLTFRLAAGTPLAFEWPLVLLDKEFKENRDTYELARDAVREEAREAIKGAKPVDQTERRALVSLETWQAMQFALDRLSHQLLAAYPWEVRREPREYFRYKSGERFLQAQAAAIVHAMTANDVRIVDGSQKFEGESLYELIHFMCFHGVEFAPPLPGDRSAYRKTFLMMREVYLHYRPDASQPVEEQRATGTGGSDSFGGGDGGGFF